MLYWESKRRLKNLPRFSSLGAMHFANIQSRHWMASGPPIENKDAQDARYELNVMMPDVVLSVDLVGVPHTAYYTPPPAIGGYAGPIDLITSIFELYQFSIEPQRTHDVLTRAIGVYDEKTRHLFWQCFNPFFWL